MPDTTPIRKHNFGEGPNRAKHSGYAQEGRETRTYHRESSIHRRKGPAPTPDYDDIDSPETSIGYKRFIDPEGSGPIHDVSHDYNPPREDLPHNSGGSRERGRSAPRLRSSTRLQAGSSIASTHATYTSCAAQKMMAQRCTSVSPRLATITAPTSAPTGLASCLSKGCSSSFGRAARSDHHTFEIEFLDPGVHAHSFTFG